MSSSHAEQDGHYPISCLIFSLLVVLALLGAAPFAFNFLNGEFHRRMQTESLAFWQAAALTDSGKAMVATGRCLRRSLLLPRKHLESDARQGMQLDCEQPNPPVRAKRLFGDNFLETVLRRAPRFLNLYC